MMQSSLLLLTRCRTCPPLAPLVALAFLGAGFLSSLCRGCSERRHAARRGRPREMLARRRGLAVAAAIRARCCVGAALLSRRPDARAGRAKVLLRDGLPPRVRRGGGRGARRRDPGRHGADLVRPRHDRVLPRQRARLAGARSVYLVDEAGRRYDPSPEATAGVAERARRARRRSSGSCGRASRTPRPSSSRYPPEARGAAPLRRRPPGGIERVLIGHENSPMHGKTYFAVPAPRDGRRAHEGRGRIVEARDRRPRRPPDATSAARSRSDPVGAYRDWFRAQEEVREHGDADTARALADDLWELHARRCPSARRKSVPVSSTTPPSSTAAPARPPIWRAPARAFAVALDALRGRRESRLARRAPSTTSRRPSRTSATTRRRSSRVRRPVRAGAGVADVRTRDRPRRHAPQPRPRAAPAVRARAGPRGRAPRRERTGAARGVAIRERHRLAEGCALSQRHLAETLGARRGPKAIDSGR